jgi:hypothetical protein
MLLQVENQQKLLNFNSQEMVKVKAIRLAQQTKLIPLSKITSRFHTLLLINKKHSRRNGKQSIKHPWHLKKRRLIIKNSETIELEKVFIKTTGIIKIHGNHYPFFNLKEMEMAKLLDSHKILMIFS